MSKKYQPILLNKITDDVVIEILNAIIPTFKELRIDYFIVGAFARDLGLLAKGYKDLPARKTNDLDLAVMISNEKEFINLKTKLVKLGSIKEHSTEPYRLIFKEKYDIRSSSFWKNRRQKRRCYFKSKKGCSIEHAGVFTST